MLWQLQSQWGCIAGVSRSVGNLGGPGAMHAVLGLATHQVSHSPKCVSMSRTALRPANSAICMLAPWHLLRIWLPYTWPWLHIWMPPVQATPCTGSTACLTAHFPQLFLKLKYGWSLLLVVLLTCCLCLANTLCRETAYLLLLLAVLWQQLGRSFSNAALGCFS